jgi:CheY-like chemotaxis protein
VRRSCHTRRVKSFRFPSRWVGDYANVEMNRYEVLRRTKANEALRDMAIMISAVSETDSVILIKLGAEDYPSKTPARPLQRLRHRRALPLTSRPCGYSGARTL